MQIGLKTEAFSIVCESNTTGVPNHGIDAYLGPAWFL
jgi:hypothetical protein